MFNRHLARWTVLLLTLWVPAVAAGGRLQNKINGVVQSSGLGKTKVALVVADADNGQELAELNPGQSMIPASNMKLLATATALGVLGPQFMFRTELRLVRPHDWQRLPGAAVADPEFDPQHGPVLIVHGDGDPAFCDLEVMRQHDMDIEQLLQIWVEAVRNTGVARIQRLIIDDRVFDQQRFHASWPAQQMNMWYCAQVAGLNVNTNCLDVYVIPTSPGQTPQVHFSPVAQFLSPSNRAVTSSSDTFWISRRPQTNEITYWGKVKSRRTKPYRVTIHDPAMFFGQLLTNRLRDAGIQVDRFNKPDPNDLMPQGAVLHAVQTTLPVILSRCNKDSQNLYAEALLKRSGRRFTGTPGSWDNGAAAVRAFLNQRIGPKSASVIVADGSGLSRFNQVTPRVVVDLLENMHHDKAIGPLWRDSFSISGVDGTLRKRFRRELAGRVYGKSGYIDGVSCLSGYLVLPDTSPVAGRIHADGMGERTIAFSFLFNDIQPPVYVHKIKKLQEKLIDLIHQEMALQTAARTTGVKR